MSQLADGKAAKAIDRRKTGLLLLTIAPEYRKANIILMLLPTILGRNA
jgi:hypothetical protein